MMSFVAMGIRTYRSADHKRKLEEHKKWLEARGFTKRPKAKSVARMPDLSVPSRGLPDTSDRIYADPTKPVHSAEYYAAVDEKAKRVAPIHNKGSLTYYGDDLSGIRDSGRGRINDGN